MPALHSPPNNIPSMDAVNAFISEALRHTPPISTTTDSHTDGTDVFDNASSDSDIPELVPVDAPAVTRAAEANRSTLVPVVGRADRNTNHPVRVIGEGATDWRTGPAFLVNRTLRDVLGDRTTHRFSAPFPGNGTPIRRTTAPADGHAHANGAGVGHTNAHRYGPALDLTRDNRQRRRYGRSFEDDIYEILYHLHHFEDALRSARLWAHPRRR